MGAIAEEAGQMDLFPRALERDKQVTKRMLERYCQDKREMEELARRGLEGMTPNQRDHYEERVARICNLESAVRLILDREVREIVQYRYIEGHRNKLTMLRFRPLDESTIARKLQRGIESVAESLKIFE